MRKELPSFGAGLLVWTLLEYGIHDVLGHRPKGRTHASREHLRHHARTDYFTPYGQKALAAAPVVTAAGVAASLLVGPRRGAAFAAGLATGWAWYEVAHRWLHTRPPRTAYGRWLRRHHLHHHFGHPRRNHGVTTPLWDHVFRTHDRAAEIRVPRRNLPELPWLTEINPPGGGQTPYSPEYRIV
ncbi:MAG: sterol desaturase family protein [Myxococcota bacterium]